ncbi:hypothetical protein GCM10022260_27050 [Gaetbulibacter aestuarii]
MENGKIRKTNCEKCHQESTIIVNKFYAKESKFISVLAGIIFFVGTFVGLYFLKQIISEMKTVIGILAVASGLLIPISIYGVFNKEDRNRVKSFNQTYVSE